MILARFAALAEIDGKKGSCAVYIKAIRINIYFFIFRKLIDLPISPIDACFCKGKFVFDSR